MTDGDESQLRVRLDLVLGKVEQGLAIIAGEVVVFPRCLVWG